MANIHKKHEDSFVSVENIINALVSTYYEV